MAVRDARDSRANGATRERILNAAEWLFVEQGFEATSLRQITTRAGANLAAVNYHFGSKEALVREVFERRLRVLNTARLAELDAAESAARGRPLALETLIEAFLLPVLRMSRDRSHGGHTFIRLLGRAYTEPTQTVRTLLADEYVGVVERFKRALFHALPAVHALKAGLGAAVDYLQSIGMDSIFAYERDLMDYGAQVLGELEELRIIGTAKEKASVLSFILEGIHPHDIGTILDREGIAIRTGHHCTQPVMEFFGIPATARASLGLYNTRDDIDALVAGIRKVKEVFR